MLRLSSAVGLVNIEDKYAHYDCETLSQSSRAYFRAIRDLDAFKKNQELWKSGEYYSHQRATYDTPLKDTLL